MLMREGPLDTLDRHRVIFLDSLFDGIGKADAGADYYFSAISAERKGYSLNAHDEALIKMFYSVIRKDEEAEVTGSQSYNLEAEADDMGMRETGVKQADVAYDLSHGAGQMISDNPSYDPNRVMHAKPGTAGNLAGHKWMMDDGDVNDPHATSDYLGDVQSRFGDHLEGFYLPEDPYAESQAQIDHHKETSWEDWAKDNEHKFLLNEHHFGRLGTMGDEYATNHALYEKHFDDWKASNRRDVDNKIRQLEEDGLNEDEIEHELRKAHMFQARQGWDENLGFLDFMLGLEWFTPEERAKVYEHLAEHGGADLTQPIKFNRHVDNPDFIPRMKRNFAQRFSGLYDSWTRGAAYPGQGLKKKPIELSEEGNHVLKINNTQALDNHKPLGQSQSATERAMNHFRELLNDYAFDAGQKPVQFSNTDIPLFTSQDGGYGLSFGERQKVDKKGNLTGHHFSHEALRFLLGIDENNQIYEDGMHPYHGSYWKKDECPFTQEEIDEIMTRRKDDAKQLAGAGRMARNHGYMHYGHFKDGSKYDYSDDDETLASYWHSMYTGGGLAKMPNDLFDLIHHHSVLFKPDQQGQESVSETSEEMKARLLDFQQRGAPAQVLQELQEQIEQKERQEMYGFGSEAEREANFERHTDGPREHSLFFSRTSNGIMPRHRLDSQLDMVEPALTSFLGPFGQAELNLFNMESRGKQVTTSFKGDPNDAMANMSPMNVVFSSSIEGASGMNSDVARHAGTVSSAHNNTIYDEYHTSRSKDTRDEDLQEISHKQLTGRKKEGGVGIHNPKMGSGGVFDETYARNLGANNYVQFATILGMTRPPMSPLRRPLRRGENIEHHALANPEELEDLKHTQLTPPKYNKKHALEALKLRYEKDISRASDEQKPAIRAEYERGKQRLEQEGNLETGTIGANFASPKSINQSIVAQPPGLIESRISGRQPISEEEEMYFQLSDMVGTLSDELDKLETTGASEKEIASKKQQIAELNNRITQLQPALSRRGGTTGTASFGTNMYDVHQSRIVDKLSADTNAIAQAGKILTDGERGYIDPSVLSAILDPNLPHETVEANIRMLARMANEWLHKSSHDEHGIRTKGGTERTREGDMVQEGLGEIRSMLDDHDHKLSASDYLKFYEGKGLSEVAEKLGIDANDPRQMNTLQSLWPEHLSKYGQQLQDYSPPLMTVRQYYEKMYPDVDIDEALVHLGRMQNRTKGVELFNNLNQIQRTLGKSPEKYGVKLHLANNSDDRDIGPESTLRRKGSIAEDEYTTKPSTFGGKSSVKNPSQMFRAKQILDSIMVGMPEIETPDTTVTERGMFDVPVDRFGPNSHSVFSLYDSPGFRHEYGDTFNPNFDFSISPKGKLTVRLVNPENNPHKLVQPLESFWEAVSPSNWLEMLRHPDHQEARAMLNQPSRFSAQTKQNDIGIRRNQDIHSTTKSEIGLADLTNPDIIRKELGSKVPLLQPMHRIFDIEDLEHLRGFTGDWIVSHMPEGERGFVEKKDDEVSSKTFDLSDEDKENFKQVTDEDFNADVIKLEDGYYIFDVIEFAEKEVHDVVLNDRIKILRGGMEGVENIHVPSASDTRLSDDTGLKAVVEDLQKEHENVLLRDANSVYMAGEMRHPKWVMLRPGRDVVLRVLERRGNGPYTYRLGTGPITQDDKIGSRAVESDGETYMDVGAAFNSPEKYNEGDHVRVNVANVSKVESADDNVVYTLTGSEIESEAEGEGLVSQETLGMLAKSQDEQWLCEVHRAKSGIRVVMPQGDVVYKATESAGVWTVHSPLASNGYLIRLSESQRPYWSPIAGAILKADLEVKEEVHESQGDGKPLIQPKKVEGAQWWKKKQKQKVLVKGLMLLDKFMKSGVGAVGQSSTGTMGLGIGYATPIESPMGPTNLHDEKTMPDFDNRKRPGEDSTIEPETDDEEDTEHLVVPVEGGELDITEDKAILRT